MSKNNFSVTKHENRPPSLETLTGAYSRSLRGPQQDESLALLLSAHVSFKLHVSILLARFLNLLFRRPDLVRHMRDETVISISTLKMLNVFV